MIFSCFIVEMRISVSSGVAYVAARRASADRYVQSLSSPISWLPAITTFVLVGERSKPCNDRLQFLFGVILSQVTSMNEDICRWPVGRQGGVQRVRIREGYNRNR